MAMTSPTIRPPRRVRRIDIDPSFIWTLLALCIPHLGGFEGKSSHRKRRLQQVPRDGALADDAEGLIRVDDCRRQPTRCGSCIDDQLHILTKCRIDLPRRLGGRCSRAIGAGSRQWTDAVEYLAQWLTGAESDSNPAATGSQRGRN